MSVFDPEAAGAAWARTTRFRPALAVRTLLDRAAELAMQDGGGEQRYVTVTVLVRALTELHPEALDDPAATLSVRLWRRLGTTNELLGQLDDSMRTLGAAVQANTQEDRTLVATLDDLTAIATQLAADDSALKTSVDAVVQALAAAKAGGFSTEQQAALDAAVAELASVHSDLMADAKEASDAVNPPPPPS